MSAHLPFAIMGFLAGWSFTSVFYAYMAYRDSVARVAEARLRMAECDERSAELVTLYREIYSVNMPNLTAKEN